MERFRYDIQSEFAIIILIIIIIIIIITVTSISNSGRHRQTDDELLCRHNALQINQSKNKTEKTDLALKPAACMHSHSGTGEKWEWEYLAGIQHVAEAPKPPVVRVRE